MRKKLSIIRNFRSIINCHTYLLFKFFPTKWLSVEQVEVVYENDPTTILRYPDFTPRTMTATVAYINSCIGTSIHLSNDQILQYLAKMGLVGRIVKECGEDAVQVDVPITRSDVLHACDVMEDVAVAYGINRIPKTVPNTNTVAGAFPLNKLSDMVRRELALAGWSEVLPLTLVGGRG